MSALNKIRAELAEGAVLFSATEVADLAAEVGSLEDEKGKILRIVTDWCIEANDVGGVDAGDLAFRLERAGFPLPDDGD